jgi:hypothetical protein
MQRGNVVKFNHYLVIKTSAGSWFATDCSMYHPIVKKIKLWMDKQKVYLLFPESLVEKL